VAAGRAPITHPGMMLIRSNFVRSGTRPRRIAYASGKDCAAGMAQHHAPNFLIPVSANIVEDVLAFHF
jgi:hypothetical protein